MNNITTIIPVGDILSEEVILLETAINSIKNQVDGFYPSKVLVIYKETMGEILKDFIDRSFDGLDVTFLANSGSASIQNQLNTAVKSIDTEYFSYLEFDDQFTNFYFKYVKEYMEQYKDVSVFLPLTVDILGNGTFVRYGNAECFSRDVSEVQGQITHDALMKVPVFHSFSGGIFKVEDFIDLGSLKENMKYTFIYEYLLRITNQDQKVIVIPKVGYIHILDRTNSFTTIFNKSGIPEAETAFWFEQAKKEFYFTKTDRKIEYIPRVA